MISLKFSGLESVISKCEKSSDIKLFKEASKKTMDNAIKYAREYAPELTGIMRDDIQGAVTNDGFVIECFVPWATFNEYGSMYMKVGSVKSPLQVTSGNGKTAFRPFMRPASYRAVAEMPDAFHKLFGAIWK